MYFKLFNIYGKVVDTCDFRSIGQAERFFECRNEGVYRMAWKDTYKFVSFFTYCEKLV